MFIATLFLPRRGSSPGQRSVIRELATGFRFIRGHRVLLMLLGSGWIGLLPAYVDQLGGGAREVGFVFSSAGIGALSGYGVRCQFAFSLAWDGAGGSCPFRQWMFNISALVAVQLRVLDAIRGHVMGVFAISQSIGLLGGLWTGALAAAIGLRAGMMVGPVVLLVLIFTVFATQRKVRELHEDTVLDG